MNISKLDQKDPDELSLEQIEKLIDHHWKQSKVAEPKDRLKILKRASFLAICAFKTRELTPKQLKKYIKILDKTSKKRSFAGPTRKQLSKMRARLNQINTKTDYEIIKSKKGAISTETATIMICDAEDDINIENPSEKALRNLQKEEQARFIFTQGDGKFDIEIRFVSGKEPVLEISEYDNVIEAGEESHLEVDSNKILVKDLYQKGSQLVMKITKGKYSVRDFFIDKKEAFLGYIIVLTKNS